MNTAVTSNGNAMIPLVSIITTNWSHSEAQRRNVIRGLLDTLPQTSDIGYELVVVDNGSPDPTTTRLLVEQHEKKTITTLVLLSENKYFCEGNNIGVRNADRRSSYLLLLNSDIEVKRSDWLLKMTKWMEGKLPARGARPCDIVSFGWTADPDVEPSIARPEGFCCMIRRSVFRELDPAFVHCNGLEESLALAVRKGARCGVLGNWHEYLTHHCGASEAWRNRVFITAASTRGPEMATWFAGLSIEPLDFVLDESTKDRIRATPKWQFKDDPSYATLKSW